MKKITKQEAEEIAKEYLKEHEVSITVDVFLKNLTDYVIKIHNEIIPHNVLQLLDNPDNKKYLSVRNTFYIGTPIGTIMPSTLTLKKDQYVFNYFSKNDFTESQLNTFKKLLEKYAESLTKRKDLKNAIVANVLQLKTDVEVIQKLPKLQPAVEKILNSKYVELNQLNSLL